MKKTANTLISGLVAGAICLGFAPSASASDQCKQILAKADFPNPLGETEGCTVNGQDFDSCITGNLRGTIKGKWVAYFLDEWFIIIEPPEFPVPEETLANYNREFEVFTTNKGEIYGDAQYVFDIRIFDVDGGFVAPIIVTGGTGWYEGATGWIAAVVSDGALSKANLHGEICGPNIPPRDDDDRGGN
jgi:hypothetical protein